jgi:mercuric ion binding protein
MKILPFVLLSAGLFTSGAAFANEQTVTLNVKNATCELCGPIVKGSLNRISGVLDVQMSEANGAAVAKVRFEDSRTSVPALITATTNAGYPSSIAR